MEEHVTAAMFKTALSAHRAGDAQSAAKGYYRVVQADPSHGPARFLLSLLLRASGQIPQALDHIDVAVSTAPLNATYRQGRAEILLAASRLDMHSSQDANEGGVSPAEGLVLKVAREFRRALVCEPALAQPIEWLGAWLEQSDDLSAAERMAARRRCLGEDRAALFSHANILSRLGDIGPAWAIAERAIHFGGLYDPLTDLKSALMLPPVPEDSGRILEARQRLWDSLERVADSALELQDPVSQIGRAPFYLAYHGLDDRALVTRLQSVLRAATPALRETLEERPRHSGRRRVGVFSTFFDAHTVLRYSQGLIKAMAAREDLEVVILPSTAISARGLDVLRQLGAEARTVGGEYHEACRQIRALNLDVLVFADIGMEPLAGALAQSAIAPRHIALSGHPVTTGIETLDGYVTCPALEPRGYQGHYTEPLIEAQVWPLDYEHRRVDASALPLPDRDSSHPLLLCSQSLFKIHPEMDAVFRRLLEQLPAAQLAFFDLPPGMSAVTDRFRQRLVAAGIDVAARVRFLPRMPLPDFLGWLRHADVVLDSWHFSGGDSTLSALAAGAPVVTRTGAFYRGNQTAGLLRQIDAAETVADDADTYIETALRLATDAEWRAHLRGRLAVQSSLAFERTDGADALIDDIVGLSDQ